MFLASGARTVWMLRPSGGVSVLERRLAELVERFRSDAIRVDPTEARESEHSRRDRGDAPVDHVLEQRRPRSLRAGRAGTVEACQAKLSTWSASTANLCAGTGRSALQHRIPELRRFCSFSRTLIVFVSRRAGDP